MSRIVALDTRDIRFPTSRDLDGSDAMNPEPDYSAAYVIIRTSDGDEGHGFAFTTGRGNDVQTAAIRSLEPWLLDRDTEEILADLGTFGRSLTGEPQLRWLGPEKGVIHMATGAVLNALWDLKAKRAGVPVWKLLSDLSPEELVDLVDFRYISDALTRSEALDLLRARQADKPAREEELLAQGYPAYTTSPGWLGYDDEKLQRLCKEAVEDGFTLIKLKVGGDLDDDVRRLGLARAAVGNDIMLAVDANQRWDVDEAISWVRALSEFGITWIEEPTSPDDVLAHAAIRQGVRPVRVATGEHVQNRIIFKQLLQAKAIDVLQLDAARVGGVNENVAILLLAAKFGVPVCPHAGGVGLCEVVRHLSMFDFVAVSGTQEGRFIEYVDHLHEHFVDPVVIERGRYVTPRLPGFSAEMESAALVEFAFPDGIAWQSPG